MTLSELKVQIALGEDSRRQFKRDVTSPDALAAELAAFANSEGGVILLGVADSGALPGLSSEDVARLNQMIGNVSSHNIRSPLTVQTEDIRNPILVSYIAKGLLPYHGLGSGIKRALEAWPAIDFNDDHDGCLFTVTVQRKGFDGSTIPEMGSPTGSLKSTLKIIEMMRINPSVTAPEIAEALGIKVRAVKKQIAKLKHEQAIRRIGPDKGGHWEVVE